ncbi:uncharacterized protein LOC128731113 [Anopheles nili]|uniref:uncharacterized protein LOC128731113 n=1 Tax=Anopheles nili TaxID=185578 RepID=UPI00237BD428|nr:uncharacterized protein LOC128731113 [Anopheles nili]
MNTSDFDALAKQVYINLDVINHHLGEAKTDSKLLTKTADSENLLESLLTLAKELKSPPDIASQNAVDLAKRPSEEEIDTLFDVLRSRPTAANGKHQRQGSFKKNTPSPLQQSRLLNETNLLGNTTTSLTNSCSDLTNSINKTQLKQPTIDVEAAVGRLRRAAELLGTISSEQIQSVDLSQIRQRCQTEWKARMRACRNVEQLLNDTLHETDRSGTNVVKKEPLVGTALVKSIQQLQTKLHLAVFIKEQEAPPDLTKTLSKAALPLSECIDSIEETLRQQKL